MNLESYVFETAAPEVFGYKHIVGAAVSFLVIAIVLALLFLVFKKHSHSRVMKVTAIFLLFLEAVKYTYAFVVYGHFPLHFIPMQLCSFSLYLMPLVAFGKGKVKQFLLPTTFAVGMLAGLITLAYPVTVLGGPYGWELTVDNILPYHSFIYHGTMIFFSLYLLFSREYRPEVKDYPRAYATLLVFGIMAMITNAIFGTDMMFLNTGAGNPFQFILIEYKRIAYISFMLIIAAILLFFPFAPSAIRSFLRNPQRATLKN